MGRGVDPAGPRRRRVRARRRGGPAQARGLQPRLVQGPRHDLRGVGRRARGRGAVICASTGNTAASARRVRRRAGLTGAVVVPEGKIATGKLAQALIHGARVIALRGNFDDALARARAGQHSGHRARQFRQPVPLEGQKTAAFELVEDLGDAPDALCIPVGNAGNITAYWKGFEESGGWGAPAAARLARLRRGAARGRRAGRAARDGRQRDPHRQPGALGGGDGRDGRLARRVIRACRTPRSSTPTAPRGARGRLLRAGVGGLRRRAATLGADGAGPASSAC